MENSEAIENYEMMFEIAKLIISVLTPIAITIIGYWVTLHIKQIEKNQQKLRDENVRKYEEEKQQKNREYHEIKEAQERERQERIKEIERRYEPHVEFNVECRFLGTNQGKYIAHIELIANNRGHVMQIFPEITLRVRGIKNGEPLNSWRGHGERVHFPYKIMEENIVPEDYDHYFVEPNVKQRFNYVTLIDSEFSYILVWAGFAYKKFRAHSAENVFKVCGVIDKNESLTDP